MRKGPLALLCFFGVLLAACASTPDKAYWTDPHWVESMERGFNFYYPTEAVGPNLPQGTATVLLTYQDGHAADVRVIKSTGSQILDGALVGQLERAKFPKAYGAEKHQPHDFQFDVELKPSLKDFARALKQYIARETVGNLRSADTAEAGYVLMQFFYQGGRVVAPKVVYVDGKASLGDAVLQQLAQVKGPDPYPEAANLRLLVGFCFMQNDVVCAAMEGRAMKHVPPN